jgi:hypothetical protein
MNIETAIPCPENVSNRNLLNDVLKDCAKEPQTINSKLQTPIFFPLHSAHLLTRFPIN